jgi:allophanate hydrolase subunit 2
VPGPQQDTLRVVLGPRADWFTPAAVAALDGATYTVSADSNRIGLRLSGARIDRQRDDELPSEGMVLGAVQVPPSGQPVVFLHDHPTTGGYPVIAVVVADDLPVCAQARPGDRLTLRVLR